VKSNVCGSECDPDHCSLKSTNAKLLPSLPKKPVREDQSELDALGIASNMRLEYVESQLPISNNVTKPWSHLKVAIYMTTHLSDEHLEFLNKCWPAAIETLPLLRDAHLILYTSANAPQDLLNKLSFENITIRRYTEEPLPLNCSRLESYNKKQRGAIQAMQDPFKDENNWFDGYDWVIRLNPDVLIRRDEWIRKAILNETMEAIVIPFMNSCLHTDFTAFRPSAINGTKLLESKVRNAEQHMFEGLEHVIKSGRYAELPHWERNPPRDARVVGKLSPVVHHHDLVKYCPNYFNARYGHFF